MADDKKTLELQIRVAADEALRAVSSLKGEMTTLAGEMKKLSGSDGAAIKKTFEQTQAAADRAAASMKLFGVSSGELRQMQAQVKTAAVDLVTKGLDPQSEEVKKLTEEYKRLGKEADDLDKAAGKNINSFGDLKNALGSLAQVAALTKALTVVGDMGAFALSTADAFQTARNEFGTLLGDMEAGAGLFNQIKDFNDKTPFSLDTLTQGTKVLLSAKVPLADLQNQLTKFGDLSQGNAQRFTSYINAFSKAAAKGKADMETLNAYVNQGVPILGALGKQFGVTEDKIVEMVSQGKISFKDFSAALDDLTAAGGQYFGGMELGSQSLAAMQEGLKESVNTLAASFGEILLPTAIQVVGALTAITNAINESPIVKGLLAGALVALTGYLAAMAVKAGVAFAAQMSLNLAVGALNPVVMAATIAVGAAVAGYTMYASKLQNAERESENFALKQRQQKDAISESAAALERYAQALGNMTDEQIRYQIGQLNAKNNAPFRIVTPEVEAEAARLAALYKTLGDRRTDYLTEVFSGTQAAKIKAINDELDKARKYLTDPGITGEQTSQLQARIKQLTDELEKLKGAASSIDMNDKAAKWKEAWAGVWERFQAEQSTDPFAGVELERGKKLADAYNNYVRDANKETIDQVNAYYDAERRKIAKSLKDQEDQLARDLTGTRVDNLEFEREEALKNINALEARRVIAAAESEEEIAAIRERFAAMRKDTEAQFEKDVTRTRLEEARQGLVDWQQSLGDTLTLALMDIEGFSDTAAAALGGLTAQLAALSASAALSGFEEFGRALGEGESAADSMSRALAQMAQQILRQLPMLFLQAGLQLIASGQWALGLGFVAAAGSTAIISGYVDGTIARAKKEADEEAKENAKGGVYDEYGRAAREYAAGGAFTNRVVSRPTYFRYGGGLGLMGEAGPEAIIPLTRGGDGRLGVSAFGGQNAGAAVYVIIQNYTNEDVRTEESVDGAGNQIRKIVIGAVKQSISSGEMDQPMSSRYGLRARGI
ncbi:MAG: tape measure protein [Treponema sp.]|jgi:tape measure domain-containing protein|nr:tape measure protein [Treponema sp.]